MAKLQQQAFGDISRVGVFCAACGTWGSFAHSTTTPPVFKFGQLVQFLQDAKLAKSKKRLDTQILAPILRLVKIA